MINHQYLNQMIYMKLQNKMRKDQTILGSDKPELITEHAAEYTKKEIDRGI